MPTVSIERFDSRTPASYQAGIQRACDSLGGLAEYVKPGQKVLLKPDLMFDYPGDCGQTTSAEFVAAIGRLVRSVGAEVAIGDSPFILRGHMSDFWRRAGVLDVALRDGFKLANFEMTGSRAVAINTRVYYVSRAVLEADLVINVPRLKRDSRVGYAGAIRNMLGTIPGFQKGRLYREFPNGKELAGILVDIFSAVQPALTVAEADPGDQPYAIVSADAAALDSVVAEILGFDAKRAFTARSAGDAGLGIAWLEGIKFAGTPLSDLVANLRPAYAHRRSRVFQKLARGIVEPYVWLKSSINGEICDGCGTCVQSCPTNALQMSKVTRVPSINHNICISCWAGLTNCPTQAISLQGSRLVNRLYPA